MESKSFYVDAALFDMDGTLTDSIAAVEAAWHKVADEIGQDPKHVIAATHGKRAIDNLAQFKPYLRAHEMDEEVAKFERSILYFADAYSLHGPGSGRTSGSSSETDLTTASTPDLSPARSISPSSTMSTGLLSIASRTSPRFGSLSFCRRLFHKLSLAAHLQHHVREKKKVEYSASDDELTNLLGEEEIDVLPIVPVEQVHEDVLEAWQLEAAKVDRSVRILPGVRKLMDSIPSGRYAVATSGAKTYAFGCMKRVGITPPSVTITADDKRLKAGKPAPDPFLLAAKCLGYDASRCVVFEDSPSGIRAGVASGATVIAVCTSHERSQIENCGAHYIVNDLESVKCELEGGALKFTVQW